MNALTIIISALTAFIISAGGAFGIALLALKGGMPDAVVWISCVCLGLTSAAKDTRSLLKLPPVSTANGNADIPNKPSSDQNNP